MNSTSKCHIVSVASAFPQTLADQARITNSIKKEWKDFDVNERAIDRLHQSVLVKKRHLATPLDDALLSASFEERNNKFIEVGVDIAEEAIEKLLRKTNTAPEEISKIIFTTVTGIAAPSIEARLMNRIKFKPSLKRVPIFGLGCVAGAACVARAADYLVGHPDEKVIVLAVELCSLTFQRKDISMANIIASGLFGDGAAAVLLAGNDAVKSASLPKVVSSRSFFFPNSEGVMGWQVNGDGFRLILNSEVPKIALENIPACVDEVLKTHHLTRNDVATWIAHPGGPKVINALVEGLNIPESALTKSFETLANYGNLSSASVLLILEETLRNEQRRPGDYGVMLAMGPGFCAEVVLLQW